MKKDMLKEIFLKFKYESAIFATLSTNFFLFFTKETLFSDVFYPLHLVDIKIGFISRTLVGSISGLLWKNPTKENIFFLHFSVLVLTFLLTAIFLGKCIKRSSEESGKNLFFISLIVSVLPYGFMTFVNLFELLDIYWVLTVVLCLLSADNKAAVYLIPLFIVTGSWVHYSFVLSFMPVIYIMFFNKCIKEKSKYSFVLTGIMIAISISSVLYFIITSRTFNLIPFEEFTEYLKEKAGSEITNIERYIGTGFRPYSEANKLYEISAIPDDAPILFRIFAGNFIMAFRDTSLKGVLSDFVLSSPIILFFTCIWKKAIKITEDKKEKFMYFLCLITPLVQVFACFTSSDTSRWLSLMIISQLFLLALLVRDGKKTAENAFNNIINNLRTRKTVLLFVFLLYLSIIFIW